MFSALDQNLLLYPHWAQHVVTFSAKCTSFCKSAFTARDQHLLSFSHWPHHFLAVFSKVRGFVQKHRCHLEIRIFSHFCTGRTSFKRFSAKCTNLCKTAFSALYQHVLSFSHWVHYFLPIFSKLDEFVQKSEFSPRSACFVSFPHLRTIC